MSRVQPAVSRVHPAMSGVHPAMSRVHPAMSRVQPDPYFNVKHLACAGIGKGEGALGQLAKLASRPDAAQR